MSFKYSTPVLNLKSCVKTRAPLVLFSFCLASIILVTFSLAIYFQVDGNVKNPDTLSLNDVGVNLNKLRFCNMSTDFSLNNQPDSTGLNQTSFVFEDASVHSWLPADVEYVAQIDAYDLGVKDHFNVTLSVTLLESLNSSICVTLYHLPMVSFPSTTKSHCHVPVNSRTRKTYFVKLPKPAEIISSHCNESTAVSFSVKENQDWDIMVTKEDKDLINVHLMAMSYILLATFFSILCFGVIQGGLKTTHLEPSRDYDDSDREPLTS